jgi:membrane fusion protein
MSAPADGAETGLFRHEVTAERKRGALGEILLVSPRRHWVWTALMLLCIVVILAFGWLGEYTRKERVTGQLGLTQQAVRQYAPLVGTVVELYVSEGAVVRRGDPLVRISIDRVSQNKGEAQAAILRQIEARRLHLGDEQRLLNQVLQEEQQALGRRSDGLRGQLAQIDREIDAQAQRLALNAENLARARQLAAQEIISAVELQDKAQENLTLQAQLEALRRSRLAIADDIAGTASELKNAPLKARSQASAMTRSINELEQQAVDNESRRELTVVAMVDGRVTGVLATLGQQVAPANPLLSVLPAGAAFEAQLFVPTRAIGFLQNDADVLLRYQAFPYQKFGQYTGKIKSIARTALPPADLQLIGDAKEQFYRVLVSLSDQHVLAYGKKMPLQDGMQLEADLPIDRRRIFEWILEPLYSIQGKY